MGRAFGISPFSSIFVSGPNLEFHEVTVPLLKGEIELIIESLQSLIHLLEIVGVLLGYFVTALVQSANANDGNAENQVDHDANGVFCVGDCQ